MLLPAPSTRNAWLLDFKCRSELTCHRARAFLQEEAKKITGAGPGGMADVPSRGPSSGPSFQRHQLMQRMMRPLLLAVAADDTAVRTLVEEHPRVAWHLRASLPCGLPLIVGRTRSHVAMHGRG